MSAGHSLRRANYAFPLFDAPVRNVTPTTEGPIPGPLAVIVTVAVTATFAFFAMDDSAASWLRQELLSVWLLLTA